MVDRNGLKQALPLWAAALVVLASAGGAGYLGAWLAVRDVENDLALRPPVLVLDVATAARGADPERIADVLAGHNAKVRRLAEAGLLVLDAQAVLAAPADLYLEGDAGPPGRAFR
jgi:hypothetical protein